MKTFGIIMLVIGVLHFVAFIVCLYAGEVEPAAAQMGGACMMLALGGFCVHRANQKKNEKKQREEWENKE